MYITRAEYAELYDEMDEKIFNRLAIDAFRVMDIHTTGVDNVKKLKAFFPEDEDGATAVKHCAAKLINTMEQVQIAEASASGFEVTDHGVHGKVISSISAGNESISYSTGSTSAVDEAAKDITARSKLYANIVCEYLRGVSDKNGVSLLYKGAYPRRFLC